MPAGPVESPVRPRLH